MICTEQERAALERILAVLKPILTDHNPPIAIDWVGKGAIAVGQEFESAINAVREHKDDAAIRAMLAPDDVVVRGAIAFTDGELAVIEYVLTNAKASATGTVGEDVRKTLHRVRSVRSGEATR